MAQPDDVDVLLTELTQILGNISFVLQTIRALRSNADRLRPMLGEQRQVGLNPTSTLSEAISTTGPVWMKENCSFSFIVKHDNLVERQ
jgi:hypothetical protein